MTTTTEHPTTAALRRLSTLRDASVEELRQLSESLLIHEGRKGDELLRIGATDDTTLYLLEGSCRLVAEDGGTKTIHHTDPSAQAPLARLRPSRYRVVAESPVRYLRIDNALLVQSTGTLEGSSSLTLETYDVSDEDDLSDLEAENQLTLQIYQDLNTDRLLLPSLPLVAVRIGEAVNDDNADARRVATLIESDPAIALKIVKAANSARFGGVSPVATVTEAVARLGMQNTQVLVITFTLRELFRTASRTLGQQMLALWEHSRRIAAITRVLADKVGGFNSHEALLAGLVHDIGVVAVIGYARDLPAVTEDPVALASSTQALRAQLGGMILSKWQLPNELANAAKEAENWYRQHPGRADYADLVIAAQLHEGIGGDIDPALTPVFQRLGLNPSDLDRGLEVLRDAEEEIAAVHQLIGG